MDIRAPTHELTRAHAVLRTRRRVADAKPDWALSPAGLASLRGRGGQADREEGRVQPETEAEGRVDPARMQGWGAQDEADLDAPLGVVETDPQLAAAFAAVDAANANDRMLAGESRPCLGAGSAGLRSRLGRGRASRRLARRRRATARLPPTLAAAIAADAWGAIEPLQQTPWLGRLLAAALLRARGQDPLAPAVPACRAEGDPARAPAGPRRRGATRRAARGDHGSGSGRAQRPRPLA